MSSRSTGRRVSRGLIGLLVVVLVLGGAFYLHNTDRSAAREPGNGAARGSQQPPAVSVMPAPVAPPATAPASASTPTTRPANSVMITSIPSSPLPQPPQQSLVQTNPAAAPSNSHSGAASPATRPSSSNLLNDGMSKKDSGDLLTARKLLNEALASGSLSTSDVQRCKAALSEINQTVVFSPKRFADDPYGGTYSVQPGNLLKKIADEHDVTWELLCRINNLSDPKRLRAGQTIKVVKGPFHAVVSKHDFTMDLYVGGAPGEKGSMFVMTYPVGLGKDDSTPTGVWMVEPHKKIKNPTYFSPRGEGVIDADDPKNPLGERWIGLAGIDGHAVGKESYGIHGTIEPDLIGKMASLGCIRMRNEDVARVYEMLVEGKSTVVVKE